MSAQDLPGMLAEIEADHEREPDNHVLVYAYNWLTDPGGSAKPEGEERVANMFATSVLHIAAERELVSAKLAAAALSAADVEALEFLVFETTRERDALGHSTRWEAKAAKALELLTRLIAASGGGK